MLSDCYRKDNDVKAGVLNQHHGLSRRVRVNGITHGVFPGLTDHSMIAAAWMLGVFGSATEKRGLSDCVGRKVAVFQAVASKQVSRTS